MKDMLSSGEVAERLGVEVATVYAYVSRGALTRVPGPGGRSSRYDPDEVEALARRARPRSGRRRTAAVDVVIGTTISEIGDGWIRYRGHDVADLAGRERFEAVAGLLWTGDLVAPDISAATLALAAETATRTADALGPGAPVSARLASGAAAASTLGAHAPGGLAVLESLVASLPVVDRETPQGTLAHRLWARFSPKRPTVARVAALDVALVVLAEHELATSTLAVRVAASTGAAAPSCVLAGLGALSGPLHGQAAVRVHRRLVSGEPLGRGLAEGRGHPVHRRGDPRVAPLLAAVDAIASPRQRIHLEAAWTTDEAAEPLNVDAALAALAYVADAPAGITEAVFAISRTAGWLAHAYEEADEPPLRFRGRTLYRGPR